MATTHIMPDLVNVRATQVSAPPTWALLERIVVALTGFSPWFQYRLQVAEDDCFLVGQSCRTHALCHRIGQLGWQ